MGNMREISIEECNAVFGGADNEIVVTATKPKAKEFDASIYLNYTCNYGNDSTFFGGGGGAAPGSLLPEVAGDFEDGEVDEGDDDGDGILNRDEVIVVDGPTDSQKTAALNRFFAEQATLPVSYWGFSGAMGLGIGFSFIHNGQTGEWDVDVAGTAGLGFFVEGGVASDTKTAQEQSEATKNGWTVTGGKAGGSAGGGSGDGTSIGAQVGAGGIITDTDIIP